MEKAPLTIGKTFVLKNFRQSFFLTWTFLAVGIILLALFLLLSYAVPKKSYFFYFLHNIGLFMAFVSLLMAYAGVYSITTAPDDTEKVTRSALKATFKRTHYIAGIAITTAVIITLIILIEAGFSVISEIPVAGPILMALFTIPIQLLNLVVLLSAICIFAIFPPLAAEASTLKDIFLEIKISVKQRWINVLIYLVISLSILFFSFIIIFYLMKYTTGITRAIQWKINVAYPTLIKGAYMKSWFTDIIYQIAPSPSTMGMLKKSTSGLFNPVPAIRYITGLSYLAVFSFVASFPLALFFNISSMFFGKVKTDI